MTVVPPGSRHHLLGLEDLPAAAGAAALVAHVAFDGGGIQRHGLCGGTVPEGHLEETWKNKN